MTATYLDSQRDWLTAERFSAYAPELNPVEYLWANLTDLELANLATTSLAEVADATTQGIHGSATSGPGHGLPDPHWPHPRPITRQLNPRTSDTATVWVRVPGGAPPPAV
jgi:hypothetical protein